VVISRGSLYGVDVENHALSLVEAAVISYSILWHYINQKFFSSRQYHDWTVSSASCGLVFRHCGCFLCTSRAELITGPEYD